MHRFSLLLALPIAAWVCGCASSGSSPAPGIDTPGERIVAADNSGAYRTTVAPNAKVEVPAAPSRVFDALKAAYAQLGVPPSVDDPSTGRIGNVNFTKTRTLANQPLSSFLNCGSSMTGAAADTYRVTISLISMVRPKSGGISEIETAFTATAKNMEGTSGDPVACGTTGRLEDLIRQSVLQKVGAPR